MLLGCLAVSQLVEARQSWDLFVAHPTWRIASVLLRTTLYVLFLVASIVHLAFNDRPRSRDSRGTVLVLCMFASFLMLGIGLLPTGPLLWRPSTPAIEFGLAAMLVGAALAIAAIGTLASNFSIVPEGRTLTISGPYRFVRHPIYLAELLMIIGMVVVQARCYSLLGAIFVTSLQLFRIRTEERLLRRTFSVSFAKFCARTRFRLLPYLW